MLKNVLDAIPDIIGVQDTEYGIISYNKAGYRFLGLTPEETKGKKCYELIGESHPCKECAASLTYDTHKLERMEKYLPDMHCWLDVRTYPVLNREGKLVQVIDHIRDITERKEAEIRNTKLEEQIRSTQKLESLGVLAGGIAHDFNNILMAIMGNAEMALHDIDLSMETEGYLRDILSASKRASGLTKQMLDYSGRNEPKSKPVDVNQVIQDTGMMLSVSVSRKTTLEYDLAANLPDVFADPVQQLQQVIMNLMTNASEALENKPGTVKLSTALKLCRAGELNETFVNDDLTPGNYVIIKVSDTGKGMDSKTLSRVFDPFFSTKFTGRGLGLAAVLGVIRAHKGAIEVTSEEGKGSVFTVYLPACSEYRRKNKKKAAIKPSSGEGHILLVDDEDSVKEITGKMLSLLGYSVDFASDGREALEKYRNDPERFACVILDLTMPVMDGAEAFRRILELNSEAKIIVSTGYTEDAVIKEYSDLNIAGMLQKPYSLSDVSQVVKKVLMK
ncbi:hypothetical protein CSA37_05525 [Candidatus Fermentibacteria bacterium]|nr:MAG: hypothetical protein CSA37_05525 [Candidatus Fermentibacteria bacterium]